MMGWGLVNIIFGFHASFLHGACGAVASLPPSFPLSLSRPPRFSSPPLSLSMSMSMSMSISKCSYLSVCLGACTPAEPVQASLLEAATHSLEVMEERRREARGVGGPGQKE